MSTQAIGAVIGAAVCLAASPYLARLSVTVHDRENARWWAGGAAGRDRYVMVAAVGAVLGALGGHATGVTALLPALVALALFCAPLVVIDIELHRLPNRLVFGAGGAALVLLGVAAAADGDWHRLLRAGEGAAAVYLALFVLRVISPRSFGLGDVKIGGVLGAYLGWYGWGYVYYGIFAGFVLGAVVAVGLLVTRRASMKTKIPFGPTLILGPFLVLAFDLVPSLA